MEIELINDLKQTIENFQKTLQQYLPSLENEIRNIILSKTANKPLIENTLNTLLSLTDMGVGKDLFVKLLDYYKTIDAEDAAFYWNEYDKVEE